jgi:type IV pilus assembly protein PilM
VNSTCPLIGLDFGESSIKLSVVSKRNGRLSLDYAGLFPTHSPGGELLSDSERNISLGKFFSRSAYKRSPLIMNYLGRPPLIRYLKFPEMPDYELAEAVHWEAKKAIAEPLDTKVVDFAVLHRTTEGGKSYLEVILVAVDKSDVSEGLSSVRKSGIFPSLMDVNALALLKVVEQNHSGENGQEMIFMDIGSSKMEINVCRDGVLRFTRQIERGGNQITRAIMEKRSISFEEAEQFKKNQGLGGSEAEESVREEVDRMVLEVQRSVDYYKTQFRDMNIKKMILMGGTSLLPGFRDYFETQFDFPVIVENPFSSMTGQASLLKELNPAGPIWAASIGLALRGRVNGAS